MGLQRVGEDWGTKHSTKLQDGGSCPVKSEGGPEELCVPLGHASKEMET